MTKKIFAFLFAILMMNSVALADDGLGSLVVPGSSVSDIPASPVNDAVVNAVKAALPDVTIDYICEEWDDGRTEWEVVYRTANGGLGSCNVRSSDYSVREIRSYDDIPAGALGAEEALNVLRQTKGDFTVVELDLDYDDGFLCYEGELEQDSKYYEFEITVEGRIIEWSRD